MISNVFFNTRGVIFSDSKQASTTHHAKRPRAFAPRRLRRLKGNRGLLRRTKKASVSVTSSERFLAYLSHSSRILSSTRGHMRSLQNFIYQKHTRLLKFYMKHKGGTFLTENFTRTLHRDFTDARRLRVFVRLGYLDKDKPTGNRSTRRTQVFNLKRPTEARLELANKSEYGVRFNSSRLHVRPTPLRRLEQG